VTAPDWRWWVRRFGAALAIAGLVLILFALAIGSYR
jgi:hypothetical protein